MTTEMAAPGRTSRRDRILVAVVPCLLVLVAVVQMVRAHTIEQSSWSGAGFGMFATYDSGTHRFVLVEVEGDSGEVETIAAGAGYPVAAAAVVPTDDSLRSVVRHVQPQVDGRVVGASVWGIRFDSDTLRLQPYLLEEVDVP